MTVFPEIDETPHQGVYFKKWVVCDIIMTFNATVVTSACFIESLLLLKCCVISCVFAQGVELNVSEICKNCVH